MSGSNDGETTDHPPALEVSGLSAGYGRLTVVHDVCMKAMRGEIVALLGPNGAGKSTTLLAVAGALRKVSGEVRVDGRPIGGPSYRRTQTDVGLVLEGRSVFTSLTTRENLRLAGVGPRRAVDLFPELATKLDLKAGVLSGGEQQMVALARAMLRNPRVLLIDELSFGLAPALCDRLFARLREVVTHTGMSVVLVEQHLHFAAMLAERAYVMSQGCIQMEIKGSILDREEEIERIYLGAVLS